jgi:hypothetical protein
LTIFYKYGVLWYFIFMKVGEAHELVSTVEQDIAAESSPDLTAWYEQEFGLDSDFATARRAMDHLGIMTAQLVQLADFKSLEAMAGQADAEGPIEPDSDLEIPPILTAEELLHEQVERKYTACLNSYETEMDRIAATVTRRSKRQHQERMALRKFARSFVDFKDVTGNDHIVLQAATLDWAVTELINEPDLAEAVIDNSADYAERHGKDVTANPANFAAIIKGSLPGKPTEAHFEKLLRGIFSTRYNADDFPAIHVNLANSVFECLTDPDALDKIIRLESLQEAYVPSAYIGNIVQASIQAFLSENMVEFAELAQASTVMAMLRGSLSNEEIPADSKVEDAMMSGVRANIELLSQLPGEKYEQLMDLINNSRLSDPVSVKRLDTGDYVDLDLKPNEFEDVFKRSSLYAKRMQHFSPYFYGLRAARNIMGPEPITSLAVPFSPGLSVEVFVPLPSTPELQAEIGDAVIEYMESASDEFIETARQGADLGISSYRGTGVLQMVCRPLFEDTPQSGIALFRPAMQSELRHYQSIQHLTLNFHRLHPEAPAPDAYEQENETLRQEIRANQRRFLGRRPIKFTMLEDIRESGLESVKLRYDPKTQSVLANLLLDDGEVELTLDRNFGVMVDGGVPEKALTIKRYYENLILKLAKKWACSREVHTSEGVVSDTSGNAANMGHFAYLRIRNGQKYRFSEQQRRACLEEQGTELALENERLKALDETGQARNSTYVREAYDPSKPPLEVYYQSLS